MLFVYEGLSGVGEKRVALHKPSSLATRYYDLRDSLNLETEREREREIRHGLQYQGCRGHANLLCIVSN